MSVGPDISSLSHAQKDALIASLMGQVAALTARIAEHTVATAGLAGLKTRPSIPLAQASAP